MHDEPRREYYEDEINLLDYWRVLIKYKKLIGAIVGAAIVISVFYSLMLSEIYTSTAKIFAPQQENSLGASILARLPGGLSGLASGMLTGGTPADIWVAVLESHTLQGAIVEKFNLQEHYKSKTIAEAQKALSGQVIINKSGAGIVSITVADRVPEMTAELANAFVEELDRMNRELITSSSKRMRVFVEARLEENKEKLTKSEEDLKNFQEKNKAIKMDDQSTATIEAVGLMKGQLMAKEVELQTLLSFATSNNPQVEMLRAEIKALQRGLRELEGTTSDKTSDILIPTAKIPDLGLRYARLLREFKIQETLFELLTQQYEMARIQEAKDSPTVQVLDRALVPEMRSEPQRRRIVTLSVIVSGFLSVFLAFFLEYIARLKENEGLNGDRL